MKFILSLFCIFSSIGLALAQPNLNIQQDSTLAIQYIEAADILQNRDPQKLSLYQKATALLEQHQLTTQWLKAQFGLIESSICLNQELIATPALQVLEQAVSSLDSVEQAVQLPYLQYLQMRYHGELKRNYEKSLIYGLKILSESPLDIQLKGKVTIQVILAYAKFGQRHRAKDLLKQYIQETEQSLQTDRQYYEYYTHLAWAYRAVEKFKKAATMGQKAMEIAMRHPKENNYNIADCYRIIVDNGANERSLSLIKEAMQYDTSAQFAEHYGVYHISYEEVDEGLALLQKALVHYSPGFHSFDIFDYPPASTIFQDKGVVAKLLRYKIIAFHKKALKEKNDSLAIKWFRESLEAGELAIRIYNRFFYELEGYSLSQLLINEENESLLGLLTEIAYELQVRTKLPEDKKKVFDYIERSKCVGILGAIVENTNGNKADALNLQIKQLSQQLQMDEQGLQLTSKDSIDFYVNRLFETSQNIDKLTAQVYQNNQGIDFQYDKFHYIDVDSLQKELTEETLMVQYAEGNHKLFIYTISSTAQNLIKISQGDHFLMKGHLFDLQKLLANPLLIQRKKQQTFIKHSHQLYQYLLVPINRQLEGKSKLIVLGQRELYALPFEVLLPSDEQKPFHELDFLVHNYEIQYHYSATLRDYAQKRPLIQNKSCLAFAPVFSDGQSLSSATRSSQQLPARLYRSIKQGQFVPLPNSKREVEYIADILHKEYDVITLLENQATKKQLHQSLHQQAYEFIHIATHSLVNFYDFRLSAIVCNMAEQQGDDLYFANEVEQQAIRADLVILSSCESGIGRIVEGEGLVGLNRSFLIAGARNVLFSLWKVNDQYTADLMIDFYKNYLTMEDYSQSLRQAKLKMLQNSTTANPRFWAPFVLIGK